MTDPAPRRRPLPLADHGALICDEYMLTMAQSFIAHDRDTDVVFEMFVRSLPRQRGYLVVAGLEQALAHLEGLRFDEADIAYLASTGAYSDALLERLAGFRFRGSVRALPEGTVTGCAVPLLQVCACRVEATLVESALLSIVNQQTMVASKTARIVDAACGRPVWDFSLRRLHGPGAAVGVARASYIAGAAGTATVVGGMRLHIPTTGTMAHHFVQAFGPDREQEAFAQFLADHPGRAVLLVDTYDTLRGVERAIAASRDTGIPLSGVRLDSGDIVDLSRRSRALLDAAGMPQTRIVVSGDLDEWRIRDLLDAGAPVDVFGVGTMLGTSADAPALGGVYKLVAQDGRTPVMKLSEEKVTDPGVHQVFRTDAGDVIALDGEQVEGRPLLVEVMRDGRVCADLPTLDEVRERCAADMRALPEAVRRLDDPEPLHVGRSPGLLALRETLTREARERGMVA